MAVFYGPSVISSRFNTGKIESQGALDKALRKNLKTDLLELFKSNH